MSTNVPVTVDIRIEGKTKTIFEDTVTTSGRVVTTTRNPPYISGPADGTNGNQYPFPVPTCTAALADVAIGEAGKPGWDAHYDTGLDDFFITDIDSEVADPTHYWQLALNFQRAQLGGGQTRIQNGDSVLWALVPLSATGSAPLRLKGPRAAKIDTPFTVTVTDGETLKPVEGATVEGEKTDAKGEAHIKLTTFGRERVQAEYPNKYVRSNPLYVTVNL